MIFERRAVLAAPLAALMALASTPAAADASLYGQIGKLRAKPGRRDELVRLILDGTAAMPGCLSYIVALDAADADLVWVSEAWDSKASHDASLALPAVRAAIRAAMPLIAGFEPGAETVPVGGHGLVPTAR